MNIFPAGATSDSTTPTLSSAQSQETLLDPNMFMKLLVAEIRNQDPTNPLDTAQLVQQLASLSQVQQGAQTNSKLASVLETLSIGQAGGLVGRGVRSAEGTSVGVIESVRYTGLGLVAQLRDGKEVVLGPGVTVHA